MSVFSVTSTADGGAGSLRAELQLASTTSGANTIVFDSGVFAAAQTILLTGGPLELSNETGTETIVGPAAGLTIDGGAQGRVFQVDQNVQASLSGLTITGGSAGGPGGGLMNNGTVTLTDCTVTGNTAANGGGVYTAQYGTTYLYGCAVTNNVATGNGGGIYDTGTMTLGNCVVSGNSADGEGGGLYNLIGGLTMTDVVVSGNTAANGGGLGILFGTSTLTGCSFTGDIATASGGGLYDNGGTNTLTDCSFAGDVAAVDGGGVYNNASGTVAITGGTFSGNSAGWNGGALSNAGTTTLSDCTISGNTAGAGGGLYGLQGTSSLYGVTVTANVADDGAGVADNGGTTTLTNCLVAGNTADGEGGGLLNTSGTAELINSVVSGNTATWSGGLGTYAFGTTALTGSTVSGNMAASSGGGVGNDDSVTTLVNCTINGNSAGTGGGLNTDNNGLTTVTDCTVSGNTAQADGGGLYVTSGGSNTLIGVTVAANSAGSGGGFGNVGGTVTLGNTIVAANSAATSGPDALGPLTSLGTNLVGEDDGSSGWVGSDQTGTVAEPLNPLIAPLGSYGGPTESMALLPGSPAINAGNNALIPTGVTTDQRGLARIVGGTVDIGAFESNLFTLAATSGSGQSTAILTAFPAPLVATVTANNPMEPVAGGLVTFTPPQSGASSTLAGNPATIAANGTVIVDAGANGVVGRYAIPAGAIGITNTAAFTLTNQAVPTITTTPNVSAVTLGTSPVILKDTATLANGYYETGNITFTLYLGSTRLDAETVSVNGDGSYTTPTGYTLPTSGTVTGTYQWNATYSGDAFNISATENNATAERTVVSPANPSVATTSSAPAVTLGVSPVTLTDTATLSGGYYEGGSITFTLYLGSALVDTETVSVNGNGTYTTPTGYTLPTTGAVTGAYQWDASYSGDANNDPAGESNATAEQTIVNPAGPSITTTSSVAALTLGTTPPTLKDTATLSRGYYEAGTITFTLYLGSSPVDTESVAVSGNGTYSTPTGYTLPTTGTVTGTYQWDASYSGDTNNDSAAESNATAEQTTVSAASPTIATTPSASALTLGTSSVTLKDTAVLSGGYYETGTITFTLYLGNTLVDTETVAVDGNGTYTAPVGYTLPTTGTVTGTYQWDATYDGDTNNNPAYDPGDMVERTAISPANPTITTTSSVASLTLGTSSPTLNDTATLSGGYYETGTITFTLYRGDTLVDTESMPVNGNGTYTTPTGYTLPTTGTVTGTYQWDASYSGDANDNSAGESNAAAEQTAVSQATPAIATTSSTASLTLGTTAPTLKDTAVLSGGYYEAGTITFTLYLGNSPVDTETVAVSGNGTYSTPTGYTLPTRGTVTGTYQWDASFSGDTNNVSASEANAPAERTVVAAASPSIVTTPSTPAMSLGTTAPTLKDTAVLSGGYYETGTITFTLVGPGGSTLDTETMPVGGDGPYATPTGYALPTTGSVIGTYQWNASYSGDANDNPAGENGMAGERTAVSPATPSIITTPSPASLTLTSSVPAPLNDSAAFAGGYYPTGTITFTLTYNGSVVYTDHVAVNGNGTFSTAGGDHAGGYTLPATGTVVGTYQWNASYSGDANDTTANDQGGTAEQSKVSPASPSITTTPGAAVPIGFHVSLTDSATLSGGYDTGGAITFYLFAPGVTPNGTDSNNAYSDTVTVAGNGTYTTATGTHPGGFIPTTAGTYEWVAVYSGDSNNNGATSPYGSEPELAGSPNLAVTKTADQATIGAGQTAGYTVTITNNGNVTATGLTLTDPLPAGAGGDIDWTIDTSQGCPNDFTITGSAGGQSLTLSTYFRTTSGDGLAPGQSISVHITSPTDSLDAGGGGRASGFNPTGTAAAGVISLGTANAYSVLGLKNTAITNSLVTITGDEGVSQGGSLANNGPSTITGNVYESASGQYSGPGTLGGSVVTDPTLLAQDDTDALNASTTAAGLVATQTFGSITTNTTITGDGGLNVIDINGSINLSNASLTLTGSASDVFIVNVTGTATFVGTGGLMLGAGVTTNHVLYNFTASGGTIASHVGNVFDGTLLAPRLSFNLDGAFIGAIIGGGSSIQLLSDATVNAGIDGVLPNTATVTSTDNFPGTLTASATINIDSPPPVGAGMFATIGFWQNPNGQATINGFNNGPTATQLGNWLASNFPNLFGASNPYIGSTLCSYGATSLAGLSNARIATVYKNLWNPSGTTKNTYVQAFAVALGLYADNSSLGGDTTAQGFGFIITAAGGAGATYNVGSNGSAFGVPNNTSLSVYKILQVLNTNFSPSTGNFYGGNQGSTSAANSVVNGINTTGDVTNGVILSAPTGVAYSPAQIRDAYGINSVSLDGTGETIAIVDAYNDPSIFQAVNLFDSQFSLTDSGPTLYNQYGDASLFLTVLNQSGQPDSLPATDPSGPGTDNWEVEEALDVEWLHAMAPGAQIVLVEANSQSLSDLMASVGTAASQPGVSVVTMSWGFPEGQAVSAADEANYDGVFNVPGVTFLASTGDYGAADPEYPAFSPNVVAVGGTSLTLNSDNSYNSETGWGYYSDAAGTMIGSGGGVSQYETEPSFQQGVQSTGYRTAPDVSAVADPATGAWMADPYNLDPSNPFEVAGGTSLSAPIWAGLVAMVNQGRAAAGEAALNSSGPSETLQALYSLPQSDYNSITSGSNGYTANAGYNLVTGLGTPIAGSLVPDLVAYHGPGTVYSGPTVGPLQDATLSGSWTAGGGTMNVFSAFNARPAGHGGFATRYHGMVTTGIAGHIANSRAQHVPGSADAVPTPEVPPAQPISQAMVGPVATGSDIGPIGIVPRTDAQAAHDAVLAGWSSSPKRVADRSVEVIVPGLASPARTPALQGNLVDPAIEGFGALPSLLGDGDQADSGSLGRPRRSIA